MEVNVGRRVSQTIWVWRRLCTRVGARGKRDSENIGLIPFFIAKVNAPASKLFCLVLGDVVVQYDHAAALALARISLTMPRRVSAKASRTAFGVSMPRY